MAHSLAILSGRIRKGRVLSSADIDNLSEAGHDTVTVARLETGDIGENAAAQLIAEALIDGLETSGLRLGAAGLGRVNIYARAPGVLRLDAQALGAVNSIDPMITIATLPSFARCNRDTMVATVKIISYGVPDQIATRAALSARNAMGLHPVTLRRATLLQTEIGDGDPMKGEQAIRDRLHSLGMKLGTTINVRHDIAPLAKEISEVRSDLVLILTASATSDPLDVAPEAVRAAGGTVTRFGLPVDPGNLLFLGEISGKPVIGLPGCARSPALNGADWVLERIACGLSLSAAEFASMGVGGLLKDSSARGMPRDRGGAG